MKKRYLNKYFISKFFLLVLFFTLSLTSTSFVSAQSQPTNLGPITNEANKQPIQNSDNQNISSCPDGSVLVGFNLYDQGGSYTKFGSLYCRKLTGATLESVSVSKDKILLEADSDWYGRYFSTCSDDSFVVGFNLIDVGQNTRKIGSLYCRKVSGVNLSPIVYYTKHVVESPTGANQTTPSADQIAASSCPDGSVLAGFYLVNMGDNYSHDGVLYCRQIGPIVYTLSATDVASLPQGGTGSNTVTTTLGLSSSIITKHDGMCYVYDLNTWSLRDWPGAKFKCFSSNKNIDPKSVPDWEGIKPTGSEGYDWYLVVATSDFAKVMCGSGDFTIYDYYWTRFIECNKSTSYTIPAAIQPVNLTITKILNANGVDILGKKNGTGIQFVSLVPGTITPSASSNLVLKADVKVPTGVYIATVVSNTADNAVVNMRTTTFKINVVDSLITKADPYNLKVTSSGDQCDFKNIKLALSWNSIPMATSYNIYRSTDGVKFTKINSTTSGSTLSYNDTSGVFGIIYSYKVVALITGNEQTSSDIKAGLYPKQSVNLCSTPPSTPSNPGGGSGSKPVTQPVTPSSFGMSIMASDSEVTLNNVSQDVLNGSPTSKINGKIVSAGTSIIPVLKLKKGASLKITANVGAGNYSSCKLSSDSVQKTVWNSNVVLGANITQVASETINQNASLNTYSIQCTRVTGVNDTASVKVQIVDTNIKEK